VADPRVLDDTIILDLLSFVLAVWRCVLIDNEVPEDLIASLGEAVSLMT